MNKVKYIIELEEQKEQLERKLAVINGKINTQRGNCSHVSVDLGYYGLYPSTGDEYCCLLCGKGKIVIIIMTQDIWYMQKNIYHNMI